MADAKTTEQRDKDWWDAWWGEDFSWDGLAKRSWDGWLVLQDGSVAEEQTGGAPPEGARVATLQDYWREQEGDLVTSPDGGQRFTRVHLPPAWKDGTPTGKAGWPDNALDAILAPKLLAGGETVFTGESYDRKLEGPDRRAQLQGCVLLRAASHPQDNASPLSARFERAAFLRDANFDSATFSGDARFDSATFSGEASFDSAAFSGDARFDSATFSGHAIFDRATFSGDARFGSATFSGFASFDSATFSGDARFSSATFSVNAGFDSATFSVHADFWSATFPGYANFASATFSGGARFLDATFSGGVSFYSATFSGEADFLSATFSGSTNFNRATFSGSTNFNRATFSGDARFDSATFSGGVSFYSATFSSGASFKGATFPGRASFKGATFSGHADFWSATFPGYANFASATFSGEADFLNATFSGVTSFLGASFDKLVSFERIVWPSAAQNWHRAFNQAVFKAAPVFTGAGFKALAAFDGTVLERGVILDDPSAKTSDRVFQSEKREAIKAASADLAAWVKEQEQEQKGASSEVEAEGAAARKKPKRISGGERRQKLGEFRNNRLAELEGGCRTLKKAMEYASNKTREQMFYRYELIARRAQAATPLSEKIFSYLYDWLGNYGASIGRPFIAVTALTLLFSGIYWSLDIGWTDAAGHTLALNPAANVDPALARALSFSASRIFPFGAFDDVSREWLQVYEATHGALAGLWLRILASLQSTFALTLVFMVGLAVRRKFQIS